MPIDPNNLPENFLKMMKPEDRPKRHDIVMVDPPPLTREQIEGEKPSVAELEMHDQFSGYLRINEIWYGHSNPKKKSAYTVGTPDFIFSINGLACGVEFKTDTGKLSEDQAETIQKMEKNGWHISVSRSVAEAIQFVKAMRKPGEDARLRALERQVKEDYAEQVLAAEKQEAILEHENPTTPI